MRLENIVTAAVGHLLGRVLRHAMLAILMGIMVIIALYQFTIAGTVALEVQYGVVNSRLIVGAVYAALALIAGLTLWVMRARTAAAAPPALASQREMQMAMLVEAVMVGYALARKGGRVS